MNVSVRRGRWGDSAPIIIPPKSSNMRGGVGRPRRIDLSKETRTKGANRYVVVTLS